MSSKILFSIALLLGSSACGKVEINVDEELLPFYDNFIKQGQSMGMDLSDHSITMNFLPELESKEPGTTILGVCTYLKDHVVINRSAWDKMTIDRKEALINHELGHCILERGHENLIDSETGKELSLMNAYLLKSKDFKRKYDYYIRELFIPEDRTTLVSLWGTESIYNSPIAAMISSFYPQNMRSDHLDSPKEEETSEDIIID
jgi:hypothetical protein